jgi:hypothetical protein
MKEIRLTQGKVALVDDWNFARLDKYNWCAHFERGRWYAVRRDTQNGGIIRMHREVMQISIGAVIDHKDRNGLNNQEYNLRACNQSINVQNQRKFGKYKGVQWDPANKKFRALIMCNGKNYHLGRFVSEVDAALAYNIAAIEHFGEQATLNDINLVERERSGISR